ncbi:MAG: hypothetical protein ACK54C_02135 [Betaproteobacteria bacterium]
MNDHTKHAVDALAVTTTVATVFQWLPAIAALLSIVWTIIRLYETKTVQGIFEWLKTKFASLLGR